MVANEAAHPTTAGILLSAVIVNLDIDHSSVARATRSRRIFCDKGICRPAVNTLAMALD
jgi:hypothetical protein